MIYSRLEGGLGNQLFQYAAGLSVSRSLGVDLTLDLSGLENQPNSITHRSADIFELNICAHSSSNPDGGILFRLRKFPWIARLLSPLHIQHEGKMEYDRTYPLSFPDNSYLIGYWQDYRYSSAIEDRLIRDFTPRVRLTSAAEYSIDKFSCSNAVGVHVRRGDYVTLKSAAEKHGALPVEYYHRAMSSICNSIQNPIFQIFSDDIDWCRDNICFEGLNIEFPEYPDSSACIDMYVLSHCRHHIIANSTFSWWAARLADLRFGDCRRVLAPSRWFSDGSSFARDRSPMHWDFVT
jgi:hypothetical protein